jgi:hypothetical protein
MSALVPGLMLDGADSAKLRHATCEYFEGMSKELSDLAYKNDLDSLAIIFEMARQDARRIRLASDDHLDRP